jgi:hypothetical protein
MNFACQFTNEPDATCRKDAITKIARFFAEAGKRRGNKPEQTLRLLLDGKPGTFDAVARTEAVAAVESVYSKKLNLDWMAAGLTAEALAGMVIPETVYVVPGLIPQGVAILAGRPKIGKSWLLLKAGYDVAAGKRVLNLTDVDAAGVLYLALEDGPRRIKDRQRQLLYDRAPPANMHFFTDWPRLDEGGNERLAAWFDLHPDTQLVVIDTLQRVKPRTNGKANLYESDYAALAGLQKLAGEYGVAIVLVHHLRKGLAFEDPLEAVNGSTGLTGCADTVLVLQRGRGECDGVLHVMGRDIPEARYALRFTGVEWAIIGDADEVALSESRREIKALLKGSGAPMRACEIVTALKAAGRNEHTTRNILAKMVEDGEIKRDGQHYIT